MRALPKGILVSFCAAALFGGCNDRSLRPLTPCTTSGVSQQVPIDDVKNVDLLFMVDNSGSMREEQQKLRREFPRMVRALVTGDIDGDSTPDGPAVQSLRVGVVTSDMGVAGIGTQQGEQAISSCGAVGASVDVARANYGDDGILRNVGSSIAASGSDPAVNCDADNMGGDDTIAFAALPAYLTFDGAMSGDTAAVDEYVRRVSCMANTGVNGCAFEQQLESVLKAITPPNETPTNGAFHIADNDTVHQTGHGCAVFLPDGSCDLTQQGADQVNAGWFREDSLFAIVVISDEDDCSASDRAVFDFNLTSGPYADPFTRYQAQTRCERFATDLVHPVQRYVDGILARRATNAKRIVYAVITGVPPTLTDEDDEGTDNIQAILDSAPMQYSYLTENRPAGPGGSIIPVPNTNLAEACHHTVPQVTITGTGGTVNGSQTISNVTLTGGAVPFVGMGLSGSSIAAGTLVTAVAGAGPYTLTVDEAATATDGAAALRALTFDATGTADTTSGSGTLTNFTLGATTPVVGMVITGNGIPTGTTVQIVTGAGPYTITMSAAATVTATSVAMSVRILDVSAVPARRIVGVARGLQTTSLNQANAIVQSICVDDFRPAVERILRLIQANLAGSCLPRRLIRNALNEVNCGVFVTLAPGLHCDDAQFAGIYDTTKTQRVVTGTVTREKCTMQQVPVAPSDVVTGVGPAAGAGWYYDDYTTETTTCTSPQRISFTMNAKPPEGSVMEFGCSQPVQDGDLTVDIGTECSGTCSFPTQASVDAFALRYNLPMTFDRTVTPGANEDFICEYNSNTCQIRCDTDADCPGGFVCYDEDLTSDVGPAAPLVCVNPTCGSGF